MARIILIVAPHPDDETFGCGGTIANRIKEGHSVKVVFLTDGRNSHISELGIDTDPTPNELIGIRKKEAKEATSALGLNEKNLIFLDFEDGSLNTNLELATRMIKKILRELKPDDIYFPSKMDLHKDHCASGIIVEESIKELSIFPAKYEYVIWGFIPNNSFLEHVDISSVLDRKKSAINEYKSQTTIFSKKQKRPILSSKFLEKFSLNTEVFIKNK